MIIRVKDFQSWIPAECRELFSDRYGDDRIVVADVDGKSFDDAGRRLNFVASDDSIDLQDEIIDAGAFHELRNAYLRNPVILSGHQHRLANGLSPAMAHAVELRTDRNPLVGVAQFGDGTYQNEISRDGWLAYRSGNQRAFSVGFRARDIEKREGRWVHTKALLLEISGVPVPANSNALVINYVCGRIAGFGELHAADDTRAAELAAMIKEVSERLKAFEDLFRDAAPETEDGDGEDANAADEREIAEALGRAAEHLSR